MDQQPKKVRRHVSKFVDLHITLRGEAQVMYQFRVTADTVKELIATLQEKGSNTPKEGMQLLGLDDSRYFMFDHFCKNGLPSNAMIDLDLIATITEFRHYTDEEK